MHPTVETTSAPLAAEVRRLETFDRSTTRQALVVLGMHRSGTSALTRVLSLTGLALPQTLLHPADGNLDDGNAKAGFWESSRLLEIHDQALAAAGSSWKELEPIAPGWFESSAAAPFCRRLVEALGEEYGTEGSFVAKDPRISLLVPLWSAALRELGIAPCWIVSMRNPAEVAASLALRDELPAAAGQWLWLRYLLAAEASTRGERRAFVSYGALLADWRRQLERLGQELGRPLSVTTTAASEIDRYLDRGLRHHAISSREFLSRTDVPEAVKRAFSWFERAAGSGPAPTDAPPGGPELQAESARWADTLERPNSAMLRMEHTENELRARLAATEGHLARMRADFELAEKTARRLEHVLHELGRSAPRRRSFKARLLGALGALVAALVGGLPRGWVSERLEQRASQWSRAWALTRSGAFDEFYYRATNPDVSGSDLDPVDHYVRFGEGEGRRPRATS